MAYTTRLLDEARAKIAPSDDMLSAPRARGDDVWKSAEEIEGSLPTYRTDQTE